MLCSPPEEEVSVDIISDMMEIIISNGNEVLTNFNISKRNSMHI